MGERYALLIANDSFVDHALKPLSAPTNDVISLKRVLEDFQIGGFAVNIVVNAGLEEAQEFIGSHFANRQADDLLLLYYTGHGLRDDHGDLYLALPQTRANAPRARSLDASYIRREMDRSFSRRQVLIIDCCHSGAFMQEGRVMRSKGTPVLRRDDFDPGGHGRYVLAASAANESAFEIDGLSVFTQHLVHALKTGSAAPDSKVLTVHDLHSYVCRKVAHDRAPMQPQLWVDGQTAPLTIALNPSFIPTGKRPRAVNTVVAGPMVELPPDKWDYPSSTRLPTWLKNRLGL